MTLALSRDQLITRLDEIDELSGRLRKIDEELRHRSWDPGLGWPPSSGLDGGSGSGPSIKVLIGPGDDGYNPSNPGLQFERVPATSVEIAALASDQLRAAKHLLWTKVLTAHNALTDAWNASEYAMRPFRLAPKPTPSDPDDIWCTSCARFGINWPRGSPKEVGKESTLCGVCHSYLRENGELPPGRLLELRAEGRVLTPQLVQSILTVERREQRERAKRKKKKR